MNITIIMIIHVLLVTHRINKNNMFNLYHNLMGN